jgi:flavorubredoxin
MKVAEDIFWVGSLNPELRVFDVIMETEWGTSYNAYLVRGGEKTALIEAVKDRFADDCLKKIRAVMDPADIDYIIANHTEPDHSGAAGALLRYMPNATVIASRAAIDCLKEIVNGPFEYRVAKDGDSLDLGGITLRFISAPFLHWPDTMFTWVPERGVLFSGDVFGCHFAMPEGKLFDDESDRDLAKAQKYYYDVIMSPFKPYMRAALDKLADLDIRLICPSHGPVLRFGIQEIIQKYHHWSKAAPPNDPPRVFIAYVSAYGNTRTLAECIARGIENAGRFETVIQDISEMKPAKVIGEIEKADAIAIGSPTFNRDALPPVWNVLTGIGVFQNKGKPAAAFGSYGWSGEAAGMIADRLRGLQMKVMQDTLRVRLVPSEEQKRQAEEYGKAFGTMIKESLP